MSIKKPARHEIDVTWTADIIYDQTLAGASGCQLLDAAMRTGALDPFNEVGLSLEEQLTRHGLAPLGGEATATDDSGLASPWQGSLWYYGYEEEGLDESSGDEWLVRCRLCLWDQVESRWRTGMQPCFVNDFLSQPVDSKAMPTLELPEGRHLWCRIRGVTSYASECPDKYRGLISWWRD